MDEDVLPAETTIGRVALRVADLDAATGFYESVIGLERLDADPAADAGSAAGEDRVVLGAGGDDSGGDPLLVLLDDRNARPSGPDAQPRDSDTQSGIRDTRPRDRDQAGLYHLAIRVPDRTALGAAIERIHTHYRLDGASDHGVSEALYLHDPEGNGLEVYCDRPRSAWTVDGDRVEFDSKPLDLDALEAESDGADRVPAGTDVGHVHLEVTDLEDARRCYVDGLGLGVRASLPDALFVAAGEYHHHVGLNTWRGRSAPAGDGLGLAWFEVVVPDEDALDAARQRLTGAGVQVTSTEPDDGTAGRRVCVDDPDGIGVRLRVARSEN